jgi:hypothetical protein
VRGSDDRPLHRKETENNIARSNVGGPVEHKEMREPGRLEVARNLNVKFDESHCISLFEFFTYGSIFGKTLEP